MKIKNKNLIIAGIIFLILLVSMAKTPKSVFSFQKQGGNDLTGYISEIETKSSSKNPFAVSGGCTPEPGYDHCDYAENDYGDAKAFVKVQVSEVKGIKKGGYFIKEAYISTKFDGDNFYFAENIGSWADLWSYANCNNGGCNGNEAPMVGDLIIADTDPNTPDETNYYNKCPLFYTLDYNSVGGDWVWVTVGRGWEGKEGCMDIMVVDCFDNADCIQGEKCDKSSGDWNLYSCIQGECYEGQTKCVGTENYICNPDLRFVNKGQIIGQCNVQCVTDNDCDSNFKCSDYECILRSDEKDEQPLEEPEIGSKLIPSLIISGLFLLFYYLSKSNTWRKK